MFFEFLKFLPEPCLGASRTICVLPIIQNKYTQRTLVDFIEEAWEYCYFVKFQIDPGIAVMSDMLSRRFIAPVCMYCNRDFSKTPKLCAFRRTICKGEALQTQSFIYRSISLIFSRRCDLLT